MTKTIGVIVTLCAPLLGACESSMRLPAFGSPFGQSQRVSPAPQIAAAPAPQVQTAPLPPPVASQELPPPPGAQAMPEPAPEQPTATPVEPPKQQAARTPPKQPEPEAPPAAPTRSSVTGNWSVSEASGGTCRVTLSSTPKLDLYNAGSSGCQSRELQRVTAWELRDDEIYLYESGGAVAARLRSSGARRFNGALAKTGAPVTLSK